MKSLKISIEISSNNKLQAQNIDNHSRTWKILYSTFQCFDEKIHFNLLIVIYLNDAGQFLSFEAIISRFDFDNSSMNHLHEIRVHREKSGCSPSCVEIIEGATCEFSRLDHKTIKHCFLLFYFVNPLN